MPGLVTLIGSGETAPGMVKVHRALLSSLDGSPKAVFLDTPAGFELGLEAIHQRYRDYFERRLGLSLAVASFRRTQEEAERVGGALSAIGSGNYILAGPGSPSYCIRHWRGSLILGRVLDRWAEGAQLVFASAAAIALSRWALPVYEIYKVGAEVGWLEGLDVLGSFGLNLAIVPHWDNTEGGTHDTSACFMGRVRFRQLQEMLPLPAVVLGIDEHTACTLDLEGGEVRVRGKGAVTVIRRGAEQHFEAGGSFPLGELASAEVGVKPEPRGAEGEARGKMGRLAGASDRLSGGDLLGALRVAAGMAEGELTAVLHQAIKTAEQVAHWQDERAALIDLLVEARSKLREAGEWEAADQVRDRLATLGIRLRDSSSGTRWSTREGKNWSL